VSNEAPTDALRLVPDDQVRKLATQLASSIAGLGYPVGLGIAPPEDVCMKAAQGIFDLYLAAPASPLPEGGGWQDISTFTESGQGSPVFVAVPTKEGGWIVGEAWKSVMEPDDAYRGNDGWWWAGTSPGDAYNDPIRFMNHGDAEWWMPLPAAPTGDA